MDHQLYSDDFVKQTTALCGRDIRLIDTNNDDNVKQVLHEINAPGDR